MQPRVRPWMLAIALLCLWAPVYATPDEPGRAAVEEQPPTRSLGDLALEDLLALEVRSVVSASKFVQDTAQAPASVTVITSEEIRLHGHRTLADVLQTVPGFYVSDDRNYSYVGVRGFARPGDYNTRVLLLVDGHRVNDGLYELALVGTELPLDLALVERVEIIRGPSSSIYGTGAVFGVVNVLTRKDLAASRTQVSVEGGTHGTLRLRATATGRTAGGLEGLFSATGYASTGDRRFTYGRAAEGTAVAGIARGLDDDRAASLFARVSRGGLTAQLVHGSREKEVPTAPYETLFDVPTTQTVDARGFLSLGYSGRLDSRTAIDARGALDWYDYKGRYMYDYGTDDGPAPGAQVDTASARSLSGELSIARRIDRHTITAGGDARWHPVLNQIVWDPTGSLLSERHRSHSFGLFVQDEIAIGSRVLVNAGLGYDQFDSFGGTVTPRMGVIVSRVGGGTLKILSGRAFRAPNAYEQYYYATPDGIRLQPEIVWTHEAVWERRIGRSFVFSGSVFRSRVSNLITQYADGVHTVDGLYFDNGDDAVARGVELEGRLYLGSTTHVHASYAATTTEDTATGGRLTNSPAHIAGLELIVPIGPTGVMAGLNTRRFSDRLGPTGNTVPAATLANLTLSRRQLGGRLLLDLSAYNLFDAAYVVPASCEHPVPAIPQFGRRVLARATLGF